MMARVSGSSGGQTDIPAHALKEFQPYVRLMRGLRNEMEIKRSRFITCLSPVQNDSDARTFFESVRKEFPDARHHCTAMVLGADRRLRRSNDDGEPSGTAGRPMLDVLTGFGVPVGTGAPPAARASTASHLPLSDIAAVVVRYFGGTLLGTGGLVRAYSQGVTEALQLGSFCVRERMRRFDLSVPVASAGKTENLVRSQGLRVDAVRYDGGFARITVALDAVQAPLADETLSRYGALEEVEATWVSQKW